MRLVIAHCQVDYAGRLTAHLPMAKRLIMLKADGSVSVHADDRAYKPLNWMSAPCSLTITEPDDAAQEVGANALWLVRSKAGDTLRISLGEVFLDVDHSFGVDPGLQKDGVEAHLQALLAEHPATFGEGWQVIKREFYTPIGPVDLLLRDADGIHVAVEVKRRGEIAAGACEGNLRRPADQTTGRHPRRRPRHRVPAVGLRHTAWNGQS